MPEPECQGCRELQRRVAELEDLVRDLQARLGLNATNSSLPPSANPPQAPKPVVKTPTGRKPGGQPGHPPHLRLALASRATQGYRPFCPRNLRPLSSRVADRAGRQRPRTGLASSGRIAAHVGRNHRIASARAYLPLLRHAHLGQDSRRRPRPRLRTPADGDGDLPERLSPRQ